MIANKTSSGLEHQTISTHNILQKSLQKTALCFSLDHCFQSQKDIHKAASGKTVSIQARTANSKKLQQKFPFQRKKNILRSTTSMETDRWLNLLSTINTTHKAQSTTSLPSINQCTTIGNKGKLSSIIVSRSCQTFLLLLILTLLKHLALKILQHHLFVYFHYFTRAGTKNQYFYRDLEPNWQLTMDLANFKLWNNSINNTAFQRLQTLYQRKRQSQEALLEREANQQLKKSHLFSEERLTIFLETIVVAIYLSFRPENRSLLAKSRGKNSVQWTI